MLECLGSFPLGSVTREFVTITEVQLSQSTGRHCDNLSNSILRCTMVVLREHAGVVGPKRFFLLLVLVVIGRHLRQVM